MSDGLNAIGRYRLPFQFAFQNADKPRAKTTVYFLSLQW